MLTDRVSHALSRRSDQSIAVLFVDLDDFKTINDSLGHAVGDRVQQEAARRLQGCLRGDDSVARLGGDEFAVLLEATSLTHASTVAQRLLDALRPVFDLSGDATTVAASVGVALGPPHADDADALLRGADLAMYAAKSEGKGRYAVFDGSMYDDFVERLELKPLRPRPSSRWRRNPG